MSSKISLRVDPTARIPLATQLSQQLTWSIASGQLAAGDELPPVRELADQLGINLHTVRAAYQQLSADGLISIQQGRRAQVLTYDRSKTTTSGTNVPSFSLGVIIPELSSFYTPLLRGIEAAAAEHPSLVFICNAHDEPNAALQYLDRLVARQVDGIVVAGALLEPDVPLPPVGGPTVVSIDFPGSPIPGVEFDLEGSQLAATQHLISHGHERIGYLTAPLHLPNVAPKIRGHQRALSDRGIPIEPELVTERPNFQIQSGETGANQLLDLPDPPTAIAATSDSLALGAFHAITSRGLRIPHDIALVGNDGIEMGAVIRPALTTVSHPVETAGRLAMTILREIGSGLKPDPTKVILDSELTVRESCGCPGQPDRP